MGMARVTGGSSTATISNVRAVESTRRLAFFPASGVHSSTGTLGDNRAKRRGVRKQSTWYRAFERNTFR